MVVSFDKFNRLETPQFILCNPACKYSNGDTTRAIGELPNVCDAEVVFNFNAMSEINFRIYNTKNVESESDSYIQYMYDAAQVKRYVFLPDIGYFCITAADDTRSDELQYKDIKAKSAEVELENRNIPYIADGTYLLVNDGNGLLEKLLANAPMWTLSHVDASLLELYRTFEGVDVSTNIYTFMTGDIQKAYDCIVLFDIQHRTIGVYAKDSYIVDTDIHLTQKDWIDSVVIKEDAENIFTALRVSGGNDLDIASVNPLRTNVVYDFSNYLSWMSADLAVKVSQWQTLVSGYEASYYSAAQEYWLLYDSKVEAGLELERLQIVLGLYQDCKANVQSTQSTDAIAAYNAQIEANGGTPIDIESTIQATINEIDGLISQTEGNISDVEDQIDTLTSRMQPHQDAMDDIYEAVSFSTYFTADERSELSFYIYEGSYEYEFITATDTMGSSDKVDQARKLMSSGQVALRNAASSSKVLDVSAQSFVFEKMFLPWTEQLETGCLINVEIQTDDVERLYLSTISVSYEDKTVDLKFGNKLNKNDAKAMYDGVLDNIKRSTNSIIM